MNTLQLAEAKRFLLQEIGNNPYHFSLDKSSELGNDYGGPVYVFNTETRDTFKREKGEILVGDTLYVEPEESSLTSGPFDIQKYYIGDAFIFMNELDDLVELIVIKKTGDKITVLDKNDPDAKYVLDIAEVNKKIKAREITLRKSPPSMRYFVMVDDKHKITDPFPEQESEDPKDLDPLVHGSKRKKQKSKKIPALNIDFGAGPTIDDTDVHNLTYRGESLRVMSTIAAIIRTELRKNPNIQAITFSPVDKSRDDGEDGVDNSRARVYLGLIRSEFGVKDIKGPSGPVKVKKYTDHYVVKFDRDYLDKYLSTKS